ncbi:MAG: hypothetical protein IJD98_01125 [Oscillospiraceae bacterium]|nr:hypothetical protein [Oscillospiraceae bacterium]
MKDRFDQRLQWLEEELRCEQEEDVAFSAGDPPAEPAFAVYEDEGCDADNRGRRYLLLFLILGVLAWIGWRLL